MILCNNILNMKKTIMLMLSFILSSFVWAQRETLAALREKYPSAKEIKIIGTYDSNNLCVIIEEPHWSSYTVLYNSVSKTITELTIDEISIYSAKIIKTKHNTIIEIIGQTHMGNGSIYLFTFKKQLLFQHYILDVHHEGMEYADFRKIEHFKTIPYRHGETFSRIFKDNVLKIDYSQFDTGRIRIYGTVLYISELDNKTTVLAQCDIERIYRYNSRLHRYELSKRTGELYEP